MGTFKIHNDEIMKKLLISEFIVISVSRMLYCVWSRCTVKVGHEFDGES